MTKIVPRTREIFTKLYGSPCTPADEWLKEMELTGNLRKAWRLCERPDWMLYAICCVWTEDDYVQAKKNLREAFPDVPYDANGYVRWSTWRRWLDSGKISHEDALAQANWIRENLNPFRKVA